MIKQVKKRQPTEREKTFFKSYIQYGICTNNILKNIYNSTIKRQITQLKMGNGFEYAFLQRKYTNAQ